LQAVEFWLPREQKQDILAELSDDIRSQVEETESELGRPLNTTELEAILSRWGHPAAVAQRYLPGSRHLIGPVLFPVYLQVLKIVALVYLLPWLLVWAGLTLFAGELRAGTSFSGGLTSFWLMALHVVAVVTVLFALVERRWASPTRWATWKARELLESRPRDARQIPRSDSVVDLVSTLVFAWLWLKLLGTPAVHDGLEQTFRITLAPLSPIFYWPILLFLLAGAGMASVNLIRPWWTRRRLRVRMVVETLGLLIVGLVAAAGPLVEVTAANPGADALGVARWANLSWYITLAAIGLACLFRAVQAGRRAGGAKPAGPARQVKMA
jgi:hypothetical protein